MIVLAAVVAGFLAGRLLWLLLRPTLSEPLFLRENHRGNLLPTAAGLVLPLTVLLVEAGRAAVAAAGVGESTIAGTERPAIAAAALGFGLLGLLDDLAGDGASRGFRGHLGSLGRGRLTTGTVKLFGGMAVAVLAVALWSAPSLGRLLIDAALVALAANLANLFDRAPGRTGKVALVAFAALLAVTRADEVLGGPAVVVAAAAALLLDDLRERLMLGDTGANVLGGVVGLGVVLACAPDTRTIVAAVLLALNLLSEVVSFSRVIGAVAPLRALDRAGRRPGPG